jgi:hypothetical protein
MRKAFPQHALSPAWAVILVVCAAVLVVIALAACSGGGGSGGGDPQPRQARVSCADVRNPDQAARCVVPPGGGGGGGQQRTWLDGIGLDWLVGEAHALQTFQRGDVRRSQLVNGELTVTSPINFNGEIEAKFDGGCGGDPEWVILPRQPFSVQAGDNVTLGASGQCGDMPLGARTFTVTAWRANGELLDQAVVSFTLVE